MKKVQAIIRTAKYEKVRAALHEVGIDFFSFTDVKGVGNQTAPKYTYRGATYNVDGIDRRELTILLPDSRVDEVVEILLKNARSGEEGLVGDGKVIITDMVEVIRIRNGEKGEDAL